MANDNVIQTNYGYYLHWANAENYSAKILIFEKKNSATNFLFHKETEKSFFINSGKFILQIIDTSNGEIKMQELSDGNVFIVPVLIPYKIVCQTDNGSISEVSTKHLDNDTFIIG